MVLSHEGLNCHDLVALFCAIRAQLIPISPPARNVVFLS